MELVIDAEFRQIIPPLQPDELTGLEDSLIKEGCRDALVVWAGHNILLDGHHRYELCQKDNIPFRTAETEFTSREDAMIWIIQNQFGRRNINPYQRSVLALKLEEIFAKQARESQEATQLVGKDKNGKPRLFSVTATLPEPKNETMSPTPAPPRAKKPKASKKEKPPKPRKKRAPVPKEKKAAYGKRETRAKLADIAKVKARTISKVKKIQEKATDEQKAKLVSGDATVNQVYVQLHREAIKEQVSTAKWPEGKYRVIYADPPWQYSNTQPDYHTVQDDHYPTMPLTEVCKLPVADIALDNAVLFLWATSPILEEAFDVIRAWGFKYKASFVWDKIKHNMGHYNSVRHEFLLVAVKGSCQPDTPKLYDSVQSIESSNHSRKPEFFRLMIEGLYPYGPKVELFGRGRKEGWEVYGNQVATTVSK